MIKVTVTNGKLNVSKLMEKGLLKVAAEKKKKEIAQRYADLADKHYQHAARQVSNAFQKGAGMSHSITDDGPKNVKFVHYNGGNGRVTTPSWSRLTKKHISRKPKSEQFWYKKGQLAKMVAADLRLSKKGNVTVNGLSMQESGHKGKVRIKFSLMFKNLREPLDTLVRKSFVDGREHRTPIVRRVTRNSITRIVWLEDRTSDSLSKKAAPPRPFLAKLAVALGKDMRTGLRKLN